MLHDNRQRRKISCSVVFTALVIFCIAVGLFVWFTAGRVPGRVILEVDFDKGVTEYVPDDSLARIVMKQRTRLRDVVDALQRAASDDRVKGLIARVGGPSIKLARAQELRDAVIAFRSTGKPALCYAETFGEFGPGNVSYYLATAFDEIYLQPSGDVGLTGLMYEQPFFRGTLDKLGVIPRFDGRKEYKSFRYMFTETKYNAPHREEITAVMNSQFSGIIRGIAERRKKDEPGLRALINKGPFLGHEAVSAKLVDGLAYRDEVYEKMKARVGAKAELIDLAEYYRRAGGPYEKGTTIALVYAVGGIERGKSGYNAVTGELVMGSDTIAEALRKAADDKDVKAVLLRIDSPGGSYVASDTIWRETVRIRKAGKPLIASMGTVAASGGYFIAVAADRIVAQPATITGSIGVLGGKMVTTALWNKLGVTWDEVHTSTNADAWTMTKDLSPEQKRRFSEWLDRVYDDFTLKVSEGRGMSREDVEKIAKGRIWTGEDAKKIGLVDELGGYPAALGAVRKALKLADNASLKIKVYPEQKTLLKLVSELKAAVGEDGSAAVLAQTIEELQPVARAIKLLELDPATQVLKLNWPEVN
ncbi:MAG TPA: signal peptide peptidase SppA [Nitrospirota bacterium]|nr:signal peptide peptidase SppA [Nitrospirota bacterium]